MKHQVLTGLLVLIKRQDSFIQCYYFMKPKRSTVAYNVSEKTSLLSGDIDLNSGPVQLVY